MTRASPHTHFHSSKLIRIFAELALIEEVSAADAFAEKLGLWMDFTDAIALRVAHEALPKNPTASDQTEHALERNAIGERFAGIKSDMMKLTTKSVLPSGAVNPLDGGNVQGGSASDMAVVFEPIRRGYLTHQRDMEMNLRPLRQRARALLMKASPELNKLAVLDAALDEILHARETKLLSRIPFLLEKRFMQLYGSPALEEIKLHPSGGRTKAYSGRERFTQEIKAVLLAELDLRFLPTLGLIEAFDRET